MRTYAIPLWGLPKWGDSLALDPSICKGDVRHILNQEIPTLSKSPHILLVFAADGSTTPEQENKAERWYATTASLTTREQNFNVEGDRYAQNEPENSCLLER